MNIRDSFLHIEAGAIGLLSVLLPVLFLIGCSPDASASSDHEAVDIEGADNADLDYSQNIPVAADEDTKLKELEALLLSEEKVVDVYHDGWGVDVWNIGVRDDGTSRIGYAGYICMVLNEHDAVDRKTSVRIVNVYAVAQGVAYHRASLGHIWCHDHTVVD